MYIECLLHAVLQVNDGVLQGRNLPKNSIKAGYCISITLVQIRIINAADADKDKEGIQISFGGSADRLSRGKPGLSSQSHLDNLRQFAADRNGFYLFLFLFY